MLSTKCRADIGEAFTQSALGSGGDTLAGCTNESPHWIYCWYTSSCYSTPNAALPLKYQGRVGSYATATAPCMPIATFQGACLCISWSNTMGTVSKRPVSSGRRRSQRKSFHSIHREALATQAAVAASGLAPAACSKAARCSGPACAVPAAPAYKRANTII